MPRLVRKHRVQRIDADDPRASIAPLRNDVRKVGAVADAPIARRTHSVQLHGRAPYLCCLRGCRNKATGRRYGKARVCNGLSAGYKLRTVVSQRQRGTELEFDIDFCAIARRRSATYQRDSRVDAFLVVFRRHAHADDRFGRQRRQAKL